MTTSALKLDGSVFRLDAAACVEQLCGFIRDKRADLRRDGILVPLSGGLDSSTVLLLCARAVGKERVVALLLPEAERSAAALSFGRMITERFDIATITRDIAPALDALGIDRSPVLNEAHRERSDDLRALLAGMSKRTFFNQLRRRADEESRRRFAAINTRHRIRSVAACLIADERNDLLVGCAHKSEGMLGLFVKFGVDDNADVMPLKNLFRTEVLQLAAHLGVPAEIIERTPDPEIIPGISDKYRDLLGYGSETLDLMVWGIEHELGDEEISSQLAIPQVEIRAIREVILLTGHMRNPSLTRERMR